MSVLPDPIEASHDRGQRGCDGLESALVRISHMIDGWRIRCGCIGFPLGSRVPVFEVGEPGLVEPIKGLGGIVIRSPGAVRLAEGWSARWPRTHRTSVKVCVGED